MTKSLKKSKSQSQSKSKQSQSLPKKGTKRRDPGKHGTIHFSDYPSFKPNLTPKEILQMGSFGGTYFRPIHSGVINKNLKDQHLEFPKSWFSGLKIEDYITSSKCNPELNKYKVKAGSSLLAWEESGWIKSQDPYGWFQWYCRFYQGRRSPDDERQVNRWDNYAGEKRGRWRRNLISRCIKADKKYDDVSVSPVIRQGLQHWGYILKQKDFNKVAK